MAGAPNNRFLGKFRGRVVDNNDPMGRGRLIVQVPDVLGDEPSTWALPCFPFTGPQAGQVVVPSVGAGVWVEFEQGEPSYPIWVGCWYGSREELPEDAQRNPATARPVVVQTPGKHKIVMSDVPTEGILLEAPGGAYVRIDATGVHISNGFGASVSVRGDRVDVNEGRLIVPNKR
ncbi:phage baseplate assembly protein [Streptomyces sp. NBRC 110611]|uniref:phage baseplate assembly protein V n=1 Tax=Streptomyces sp. NBRC 110611 TaxID=1621259 RepID=UPI000829F2D2|nr:phage baseplate assembly protein V [Streptomyces sp. NBRC 110611]GAU64942.1 phage baseplate assembly protein [Streptomyces sp. NBRC 110611]